MAEEKGYPRRKSSESSLEFAVKWDECAKKIIIDEMKKQFLDIEDLLGKLVASGYIFENSKDTKLQLRMLKMRLKYKARMNISLFLHCLLVLNIKNFDIQQHINFMLSTEPHS